MTTQENASEISLPDMTIEQREQFHRENAWTPAQLLNRLQELGLETRTVEHNPVFTVEKASTAEVIYLAAIVKPVPEKQKGTNVAREHA